jgi:2,5-dihydroxypyridine 5,6-dioxygenase
MPYGRLLTNPAVATELVGLFRRQLELCSLRPGELCIVVTDTAFNPVATSACLGAAWELGADAYQMTLAASRPLPGKSLRGAWREADLLLCMTTAHRLHYRDEIRDALDRGARMLTAVEPIHAMQRLTGDPAVIRRTKAGARLLDAARTIRVTSDAGTDLVMDKTGRPGLALYGVADEPGHLDFWGAGMASAAQIEGSVEGRLVLNTGDVVFHLGRYIEHPVTVAFREGRAVSFEGGLDAFLIKQLLESYREPNALMAGHMAWGTDHRAQWHAPAAQFPDAGAGGLDIESRYGNVQIEVGSNNDIAFRGKNDTAAHLGLCMLNCSLYLDGRPILDRGEFMSDELRQAP